jgi:hypothetical protein
LKVGKGGRVEGGRWKGGGKVEGGKVERVERWKVGMMIDEVLLPA